MPRWTKEDVEKLKNIFYDATRKELSNAFPDRSIDSIRRKAYRLDLERHQNIARITSVKEVEEINLDKIDDSFGYFIAGFVAGEGTFTYSHRPTGTVRFSFKIQLANDDKQILKDLHKTFDCGNINEYEPRRENEKGSIHFAVNGFGQIVNRVIPFFDKYGMFSSRKQRQYDEWRQLVSSELPNRKV